MNVPSNASLRQAAIFSAVFAALCAQAAFAVGEPATAPVALDQPLSLSDTIRLGVTQNIGLLSERTALKREISRQRSAWQSYSPTLRLRSGLSQFGPATLVSPRSAFSYAAGMSWVSPIGTVVSAEAEMLHPLAPTGHNFVGAVDLSIAQPLLKDAWLTGAALPLRETEVQTAVQRELFRDALNATILQLENAYWNLAVAESDVLIKTRSRDRAQQQFEDTRENIRRGILADVEIYVVQENVVFFEQELIQAKQNLGFAQRELTELLAVNATAPVRAAAELVRPTFGVPAADAVLEVGLNQNPRLIAQQLRRELAEVRERYAVNQALPRLDLAGGLRMAGVDPAYPSVWGATVTDPIPAANVGLVFELPLDRGSVDAAVQTAKHEAQRQGELLDAERQRVQHEILDGLTALGTLFELLTLTEKEVELADLKLKAENDKYKNGISTLTDVVRFQRDLDNSSIRLRRVIASVQVGRARLLAAQGTLHDVYGIELK